MTRHQGFDVRVAPEVLATLARSPKRPASTERTKGFARAMRRLRREGTRAEGVKKLKGLDLWEIRFESHRAFFRLVPRTRTIAVGFVQTKKSWRIPMRRLRHIERVVRGWSDELEAGR